MLGVGFAADVLVFFFLEVFCCSILWRLVVAASIAQCFPFCEVMVDMNLDHSDFVRPKYYKPASIPILASCLMHNTLAKQSR